MASLTAHGFHSVAQFVIDRPFEYDGKTTIYREIWALRSDGAVLSKVRHSTDYTGERRPGGTWTITLGGRTISEDNRTPAAFAAFVMRMCAQRDWTLITDDMARDEQRASVAKAAETRARNAGPDLTDAQCAELHGRAHAAGMLAGALVGTVPMVVAEHANMLDDSSPVVRRDIAADGPCGHGIIHVSGNGKFNRWALRNGWHTAYRGGTERFVHAFGQSATRKGAYARAYAAVLQEAGIKAYGTSRED